MNTNRNTAASSPSTDDTSGLIYDMPCTGPFPSEPLNIPIFKVVIDPLTGRPEVKRG